MNSNLFKKSIIHEPRGFKDGYATLDHDSGTLLSNIFLRTSSRSLDIDTNPSIAFARLSSDLLIVMIILLYLISSYYKTVFIDYSYLTGCVFDTNSVSNALGILLNNSAHFSLIISSADFPPPIIYLGNNPKMVSVNLMAFDI
jgi:hypothetical protein